MTAQEKTRPEARPGFIRRLWNWFWRPAPTIALGTLLSSGVVAGVILWGGFNWAMEMTNTETFCISCHEMKDNVYGEYRATAHYTNGSGVRASCPDCHVPKEWGHKVVRKIYASKELYHHFLGSVSTPEKFEAKRLKLATNEWARMKRTDSRECRNCYDFNFMDYASQEPRASTIHQAALTAGQTCIDCHQGIAHRLPPNADEAYRQLADSMDGSKSLADYLGNIAAKALASPPAQ